LTGIFSRHWKNHAKFSADELQIRRGGRCRMSDIEDELFLSRRSRNQTGDSGHTAASAVRAILDDPPIHIRPHVPAARVQSKQTLWVYAIPAHL
jgi:hypothetical protein